MFRSPPRILPKTVLVVLVVPSLVYSVCIPFQESW